MGGQETSVFPKAGSVDQGVGEYSGRWGVGSLVGLQPEGGGAGAGRWVPEVALPLALPQHRDPPLLGGYGPKPKGEEKPGRIWGIHRGPGALLGSPSRTCRACSTGGLIGKI